ncbi:DUF2487 family protein [Neobacillus notoginsengisoli]|uniref:DUF2487 family protein n=1 Tax=Neobacillus notoginsengisoli TaxID=1578198 RepID=A0A417YVA4_9BACI|nr:YpiF family protein [Neobacillus notoginsengisoli]RHW41257.1 DUF2487 family protein [Neobacillus notoginsengisoli]
MKWTAQDLDVYKSAKEYVDTALLPLVPVAFGEEMGQSASMSEYTGLLASQLERQFTGRLILLPAFTYIQTEKIEEAVRRLNNWEEGLTAEGIKHIFLLTCDENWRFEENKLKGSLIWLPVLPLSSIEEQQRITLVNGQIKQLMKLFTAKWNAD